MLSMYTWETHFYLRLTLEELYFGLLELCKEEVETVSVSQPGIKVGCDIRN